MTNQNHIFRKIRSGSRAEKLADRLSRRSAPSDGKSISTVGALDKAGLGLRVSCSDCGSDVTYAGKNMRDRFGATTPLKEISGPCGCGSRAVSRIPVSA